MADLNKNVFLIGMPGTGKTYWLHALQKQTNWPGLDLDQEIERTMQKPIAEIFLRGEDLFRSVEKSTLREILAKTRNQIIATGGGTPCSEDNWKLMSQSGIIIYLQTKIETLAERLLVDSNIRPLIKQKDKTQLLNWLNKSLEKRANFYNRADLIVKTEQETVADLVVKLKKIIKK